MAVETLSAVESRESLWLPWTTAVVTRANVNAGAVPNQPNDGVPETDSVFGSLPRYAALDATVPHLYVEKRGYFLSEFNNTHPDYQYNVTWRIPEPGSALLGLTDDATPADPDPTAPVASSLVFFGSGDDDMSVQKEGSGWTGARTRFVIVCTAVASPDEFKVSIDGELTWIEGLSMSGSFVETPAAGSGVSVKWDNPSGHRVGDRWEFVVGERLATGRSNWRVDRVDLWSFVVARRRVVGTSSTVPLRIRFLKQEAGDDLVFTENEEDFSVGVLAASAPGESWSSAFSVSSHFSEFTPTPTERHFFQVALQGDPSLDRVERRFSGVSVWYVADQERKIFTVA